MTANPFTPVFGGKPDFFFGRKDILTGFGRALEDRGSEYRALFITGTRGSGKTALLEQLSTRAKEGGWETIDLGPENTVHALVRRLAGHDEETKTLDPRVSVSVLGSGGSFGGMATSKTVRVDESDLDLLLIDACSKARNGVMVTIDEIQKLPERDISAISNAFQMASRKGCDVMLVVAGLPFSHDEIIKYRGCTFMRRAVHERIGLLSRDEVVSAFDSVFARYAGNLPEEAISLLTQASFGHPYMVQLLGYYLFERMDIVASKARHDVSSEDFDGVCRAAIGAYRSRALRPMVDELSQGERQYLQAMAKNLDGNRIAGSAEVARSLGRNTKQLSPVRERLLKSGLIVAAGKGELMFAVPYLADFLLSDEQDGGEIERLRSWGV